MQVACDYDDVGGRSDGCFDLEYRTGHGSPLFHCTRRIGADDVERVFLDYYFRATVIFKSGLVVASSYRIPLK